MNFPGPGQTFPGKNDVYIFIVYQNYFESHLCCESHGIFLDPTFCLHRCKRVWMGGPDIH